MELYSDFERQAVLLLEGVLSSSLYTGEDVLRYSSTTPAFYLGVPGRLLATNVTFKQRGAEEFDYNSMVYLTDCLVATFEHELIYELFHTDNDFSDALALSMIRIMEDSCRMSAILRTESVFACVSYFMQYLVTHHIYLTQRQIADVTGHDRASVSKAVSRIKQEDEDLWKAYLGNKGHVVEMC
ncbi:MAG: hypothetical protein AB2L09_01225 [Coriobacteriia bacterium]